MFRLCSILFVIIIVFDGTALSTSSSLDGKERSMITKGLQEHHQIEKDIYNEQNISFSKLFSTNSALGVNFTEFKQSIRVVIDFGRSSLNHIWSTDYIHFMYTRIGFLICSWIAQFLIFLISYFITVLIPKIFKLMIMLFHNPRKVFQLTIDYCNNIYSQLTFKKVIDYFFSSTMEIVQALIQGILSSYFSVFVHIMSKGIWNSDRLQTHMIQLEEFLFGTLEHRQTLRRAFREADDRKNRMEKKLFLDLMQICWNVLQKNKERVELFMPTEEFFSVDELFADVPELKKDLFEAAERSDNDVLPEFIVRINNYETNRELVTRVVNRCSQSIKNSDWPIYAKNHRLKNLEGDPYDSDDENDDVCMIITCETQGDISYDVNTNTWRDGNCVQNPMDMEKYYIPEPPRKCIRIWLMFESQLKLMMHERSWKDPKLIALKSRDWRLRLKNTHLWCLEHDKYKKVEEIVNTIDNEIYRINNWIESIKSTGEIDKTTEVDEEIIIYSIKKNSKINKLAEDIKDLKKITEPSKRKCGKKKLEQEEEQNKYKLLELVNCRRQLNAEVLSFLKIEVAEKEKQINQKKLVIKNSCYSATNILIPFIDRRLNSNNAFCGSNNDGKCRSCGNITRPSTPRRSTRPSK